MSAKKTVLNSPPPAPVPLHPMCYIIGALLFSALGYIFYSEFLTPANLAQNSNDLFFEYSYWLVLAVLSTPHIVYMFIWWAPNRFAELATSTGLGNYLSRGHPPNLMHFFVTRLKAVQFITVILWRLHANGIDKYTLVPADLFHIFDNTSPLRLAAGIAFLVAGQTLNVGVYNAIGKDGVNYGFKLGAPGPWVTCFPYNLGLRHAQYVGCHLSIIGLNVILITSQTFLPTLVQTTIWCIYYVYSAWMEASSDMDTNEDMLFDPKVDKKGELTVRGGVKSKSQ